MRRIAGTDKVEVFEEFTVVELFLKRQSGARETGNENDGWFGRVASSVSPDPGTVLRLYELSKGWHGEESRILLDKWIRLIRGSCVLSGGSYRGAEGKPLVAG